jgi:hypothetical protein
MTNKDKWEFALYVLAFAIIGSVTLYAIGHIEVGILIHKI